MIAHAFIKKETNQYPFYEGDVRLHHPHIREDQTGESFPELDTFIPVIYRDPPDIDHSKKYFKEKFPEQIDGVWYVSYEIIDYTQEELDAIEKFKLEEEKRNLRQRTLGNDAAGSVPSVAG